MEISSTFWLPDITNWWHQQKETHSKYSDLSNVLHDSFSIIPHGVEVEASFSLGRYVISWRQSKTTGKTLRKKVVVRQFARANIRIMAGAAPELHTMNAENDSEMMKEAEGRKLHIMAKVHDFLEIWQGSQNLHATQKKSRTQNKQMTTMGYISDTEEIVKASWSLCPHDGAAAFKLSARSPLPPPLSAKDLPGGRTQMLNVRRIPKINCHPVESDEDSVPEIISDSEDLLNWNGDWDDPDDSEDDCRANVESNIGQDNSIENLDCPQQWDLSGMQNVPGLIRSTRKSKWQAEIVSMKVNAIETRSTKGGKKKYDRMCQCFTSFCMYLDQEF